MDSQNEETLKLRALINEVRKQGRECLYDASNANYKNNMIKQIIWGEIAEALHIEKKEVQNMWKNARQKYKLSLQNAKGKSGCSRREPKPITKMLLLEMDFLKKYVTDKDPTVCSLGNVSPSENIENIFRDISNVLDDDVFDVTQTNVSTSTATPSTMSSLERTPIPKKRRLSSLENAFTESCNKLDQLSKAIHSSNDDVDPFFLSLNADLKKLTEIQQQELKMKFSALIYEKLKEK